jgi:hypothetical protein
LEAIIYTKITGQPWLRFFDINRNFLLAPMKKAILERILKTTAKRDKFSKAFGEGLLELPVAIIIENLSSFPAGFFKYWTNYQNGETNTWELVQLWQVLFIASNKDVSKTSIRVGVDNSSQTESRLLVTTASPPSCDVTYLGKTNQKLLEVLECEGQDVSQILDLPFRNLLNKHDKPKF